MEAQVREHEGAGIGGAGVALSTSTANTAGRGHSSALLQRTVRKIGTAALENHSGLVQLGERCAEAAMHYVGVATGRDR